MNKQKSFSSLAIVILCLFAILIASCTPASPKTSQVEVISHTLPEVPAMDVTAFQNVGCTWQNDQFAPCDAESVMNKLGCDAIYRPSPYLNLLDPAYEMVSCSQVQEPGETESAEEGIYEDGCMLRQAMRLVTYDNGNYHLIRNKSDLQNSFAPIENKEEALAYAIAATGYTPLNQFDPPQEYRYLVEKIEETHVIEQDTGYLVNLYKKQFCGCGPHPMIAYTILVGRDGSIVEQQNTTVFEDPAEDDLCVD